MTRPRHVPLRRCVACRVSAPKRSLVRLVRTDHGWALDLRQRAGGRGTSLCPACALAAVRRDDPIRAKGFRRAFRQDADAVAALLADVEGALAAAAGDAAAPESDAASADAAPAATAAAPHPAPRASGRVAARPDAAPTRPNGGMHG